MRVSMFVASAVVVALGATACSENTMGPRTPTADASLQQSPIKGTGLALNLTPTVTLPLGLGGSLEIDQSIISSFALLQNTVSPLVGLEATGTLTGTEFDVLGNTIGVITSPFTADVALTSSGTGQCSLVTLDLSNLNINALGLVNGTVPANVTVKGSGAVGSLLCNLGSALSGLTSGLTGGSGAQGLVNALNNQIGG